MVISTGTGQVDNKRIIQHGAVSLGNTVKLLGHARDSLEMQLLHRRPGFVTGHPVGGLAVAQVPERMNRIRNAEFAVLDAEGIRPHRHDMSKSGNQ